MEYGRILYFESVVVGERVLFTEKLLKRNIVIMWVFLRHCNSRLSERVYMLNYRSVGVNFVTGIV